jgi:hydrogenase 3 maturation protease
MKTLKSSWKQPLSKFLKRKHRIAVVGVGQELHGDDAAGILIIRRLQEAFGVNNPYRGGPSSDPFLLLEAGVLPERATGAIRRYQPELIIFLDAADMLEPPGTIRWIEPQEISSLSIGTHGFPLGTLSGFLAEELGCPAAVIGIQPKTLDFDAPLSDEVRQAVETLTSFFMDKKRNWETKRSATPVESNNSC